MSLLTQIPGYTEAIGREQLVRMAAFLPLTESIGGFEVLPMTWRHYTMLRIMGSPLLPGAGEEITEQSLAAFLWVLLPGYSASPATRDAFYRSCARFMPMRVPWYARGIYRKRNERAAESFLRLVIDARRYVAETFQDAPGQAAGQEWEPSYYDDATWLCAHFGREFGWVDEVTLETPLKRIFQYLKEGKVYHKGAQATLFNPSDKVRSAWLRERNAKCS